MNDSVEFNPNFPSRSASYLLGFHMYMPSCIGLFYSRNWIIFLVFLAKRITLQYWFWISFMNDAKGMWIGLSMAWVCASSLSLNIFNKML